MNLKDIQILLESFNLGVRDGRVFVKRSGLFSSRASFFMAGMGGSILAAELFRDLTGNNFQIIETYSLPKIKDGKDAVVFCFSYSGNTEETLSVFRGAEKLGIKTLCFSRGGRLKKLSQPKNFFEIPDFLAPRLAVPFMLGVLWGIFSKGSVPFKESPLPERKRLSTLIGQMKNKIILVYSPHSLRGLAHFWEINVDETAKQPCFCGEIPDINHHDLASFTNKKFRNRFFAIFLEDNSFLNNRINLTAKFFGKYL